MRESGSPWRATKAGWFTGDDDGRGWERNEKSTRPFVLYSLRHTFLTRLGQSGCDVWTLARIAGHASITISSRYVHPSEDAVLDAISRLGGHRIGHNENTLAQLPIAKNAITAVQ